MSVSGMPIQVERSHLSVQTWGLSENGSGGWHLRKDAWRIFPHNEVEGGTAYSLDEFRSYAQGLFEKFAAHVDKIYSAYASVYPEEFCVVLDGKNVYLRMWVLEEFANFFIPEEMDGSEVTALIKQIAFCQATCNWQLPQEARAAILTACNPPDILIFPMNAVAPPPPMEGVLLAPADHWEVVYLQAGNARILRYPDLETYFRCRVP